MKNMLFIFIVSTAVFVHGQEFKWSFTAHGTAFTWATDGKGALAVAYWPFPIENLVHVAWIDNAGRVILTNDIPLEYAVGNRFSFVRCNKSELAVNVANLAGTNSVRTNLVRRFKRNGTFKDTSLNLVEFMDPMSSLLKDDRGFFTRKHEGDGDVFLRYSN